MTERKLIPGQEDYWAGYEQSIEKMANDPAALEFDKLCFEVFGTTAQGKKLLEYFKERIIMPSIPGQLDMYYDKRCIYYEGYKEAFRQLMHATNNYLIRREAEDKKIIAKKSQEVKR